LPKPCNALVDRAVDETAYWRDLLRDAPALDLPYRPLAERTRAGRQVEELLVRISPECVDAVAAELDVGSASVLLGSCFALLARDTQQTDLAVSAALSTSAASTSLPLRVDLSGSPSLATVVQRLDSLVAEGSAHRELSFDRLLDHLSSEDAPRPESQVLFEYAEGSELADARRFDLALQLAPRPDRSGLLAGIDYRRGAFDEQTPARMLGHLETLIRAGLAAPDEPISSLPLLTEREQQQLLEEWNATASPYPARCVHELIADQAASSPEQVAIEYDAVQLTYSELAARADLLAGHLRSLGVGPRVLVGICCDRSVEMVVGLLGVLGAGGAYVPVDPGYPLERQAFILEDAEVAVLLTHEHLLGNLPATGATIVCLDRDWPEVATGLADPLPGPSDPERLAYVIYTSGSTGKPKGVQVPHRALVNFLTAMRDKPGFGADDVLLGVTTLSFDIAGLELYLPLLCGGRLVVASAEAVADPRALASLIEQHEVTVMQATPTTWRMLVDSGWTGRPGLRALCGGEALPPALAEALLARDVELWNLYGPTETTIWSTVTRIEAGDAVSIGRPIANTSVYVLDPQHQPVPVGVFGELYIGGDGLAQGYLRRPELTAERFIAHPFADRGRLYKTGDRVRYRADGALEYHGRLDFQVKVRGFRIELGEIEAALARNPSVRAAVAAAHERSSGESELVGYVVAAGSRGSSAQLRRELAETLPGYMVPTSIVWLDALPLTPNGKVDRKALPDPKALPEERETPYVAPRTRTERELVRIWERVLETKPIGVADDFFELGVTSVVAARLFARIQRRFGPSLPLAPIFATPTVESLARLIDKGTGEQSRWTSLVPIQAEGSKTPIFCIHGGAGTILNLEPLARRLGPDQPFYGLQSRGLYGGEPPLTTVEQMAAHYLSELREVQPHGPYCLVGYCFGALVAYDIAQRLLRGGEQIRMLAFVNGPSPAYLRSGGRHRRANRSQTDGTVRGKARRALQEPRRIIDQVRWRATLARRKIERPIVKVYVARRWPLPQALRDNFFVNIHLSAQRVYAPDDYPGEILSFQGQGLYSGDPELGWGELAQGGIETLVVPGEHVGTRQAMWEPYVGFIAKHIRRYLEETDPDNPAATLLNEVRERRALHDADAADEAAPTLVPSERTGDAVMTTEERP
jgi:surfactin family lipopeptide synthetase A